MHDKTARDRTGRRRQGRSGSYSDGEGFPLPLSSRPPFQNHVCDSHSVFIFKTRVEQVVDSSSVTLVHGFSEGGFWMVACHRRASRQAGPLRAECWRMDLARGGGWGRPAPMFPFATRSPRGGQAAAPAPLHTRGRGPAAALSHRPVRRRPQSGGRAGPGAAQGLCLRRAVVVSFLRVHNRRPFFATCR